MISVDTKKKELVGAFKNAGAKWDRVPELVKEHDFRSEAEGRAIPYGIYDPQANTGTVFVGATADTPAFAVDCIEKWWRTEGRKRYPQAETLQILADSGGSNGCAPRAWKFHLQHRLCNRHRLRVTVAHYPTAASKWNPIETPAVLKSAKTGPAALSTVMKPSSNTCAPLAPRAGLRVRAHLVKKIYKTGLKVTDAQMQQLCITSDTPCPMELHHRTHVANTRTYFCADPKALEETQEDLPRTAKWRRDIHGKGKGSYPRRDLKGVGKDSIGVREEHEGIHEERGRGKKRLSTKGHEERRRATKGLEEAQEGFAKGREGGPRRALRDKRYPRRATKNGKGPLRRWRRLKRICQGPPRGERISTKGIR